MKSYRLLIVAILALAFTSNASAQTLSGTTTLSGSLTLTPPPTLYPAAHGIATSGQVAALIVASTASLPSGAVATEVNADANTVQVKALWNNQHITVTVPGSTSLLQAIAGAGAALPAGKTVNQVRSLNVLIPATGTARESVNFSS